MAKTVKIAIFIPLDMHRRLKIMRGHEQIESVTAFIVEAVEKELRSIDRKIKREGD